MAEIAQRKHSASHLGRRILGGVWRHPNNRSHRARAVTRSLAWQVQKRVSGTPRVRTVYGSMLISMDPRFGSASNLVYFGDRFDVDEMAFMDRYLREGDRFVDVGANIGTYTLFAATLVGPTGSIDCFEAVPTLVEALRHNIELNRLAQVTVHPVAVSDSRGVLRFRADQDVSSRIAVASDPDADVLMVDTVPLDEVLTGDPISLIKIDVEGAEPAVLRGFAAHLARHDPAVMLLEILPSQLERMGSTEQELIGLLDDAGYDLAVYSAEQAKLTWLRPGQVHGNALAIARARRDEVFERLCLDASRP